jgi:hypothetical protein
MEITRDEEFSKELLDKIYRYHTEGREDRSLKWHVSDLLFPRYAVLQRLEGVTPTTEDVGFFFTGEAYHQFIQKILGAADAEIRMELFDVLGTADYLNSEILIEFKTSRKWTVPEMPQDHYIEQIGYYAAMSGKRKARIVVIFPTAGRKWDGSSASTLEIVTWSVSWTDEEIEEIKAKMQSRVELLNRAVESLDLSTLPVCPDWKLGAVVQDKATRKYEVKARCPFLEICKCPHYNVMLAEATKKNAGVGSRGGKRGF